MQIALQAKTTIEYIIEKINDNIYLNHFYKSQKSFFTNSDLIQKNKKFTNIRFPYILISSLSQFSIEDEKY